MTSSAHSDRLWISTVAEWLSPRRIRAQAALLAFCIWGVCAVDFATPGLLDRAGNIKFQDFLPTYISASLIAEDRAADIYDPQVTAAAIQSLIRQSTIRQSTLVQLPNLYGPQVGLFFLPLSRFSFPVAARIWVAASVLVFAFCIYLVWNCCPSLHRQPGTVALCAIAFPPLFHFFVRAQMSTLVLACFSAAFLAFRSDHHWLAGIALGFLVFKPQFLVAIPLVLLLSHAWRTFAGLLLSAGAQLTLAGIYFGPTVMRAYLHMLWHMSRVIGYLELTFAPIQMHSLRSFWTLLIPWPQVEFALYLLSSIVMVGMTAMIWKSSAPLALRFSALTLAAVLANPHLFVYDLLVLAPVLLLLVDSSLTNAQSLSPTLQILSYLTFVLPLFGPLSRWTHVQLSVPTMCVLTWILWRLSRTPIDKLASNESGIV